MGENWKQSGIWFPVLRTYQNEREVQMIMKKCLYCMEDYEEVSGQCPVCGHSDSLPPAPEGRLIPGSVLMGRFLVGELQANYFDEARYIGWDQVLLRKVSIWEYMGNETESFRKTAEKIQLLDAMPGLINVWKVFEKKVFQITL